MILGLFSCKSGKTAVPLDKQEALIHYSKGPCLGDRCPIYDLWIFPDGSYVYKTPKGAYSDREKSGTLSQTELSDLLETLNSGLKVPTPFKQIRDRPTTKLAYEGKTFKYHASRTKGSLTKVNAKLENLVAILIQG